MISQLANYIPAGGIQFFAEKLTTAPHKGQIL